jgi:hypothetical protein
MWGGSDKINAWVDQEVGTYLMENYGVSINRVPMDASEFINNSKLKNWQATKWVHRPGLDQRGKLSPGQNRRSTFGFLRSDFAELCPGESGRSLLILDSLPTAMKPLTVKHNLS